MMINNKPIAVSIGEPAGVGPDIILQTWANRQTRAVPDFYVIGDRDLLLRRAIELDIAVSCNVLDTVSDYCIGDENLSVFQVSGNMKAKPAEPDARDAKLVIEAIETGVNHVMTGDACGLVTCPINKAALYQGGFAHPGHTEYLAELCNNKTGKDVLPVMMLAGPELRTVPLTIHIPLSQVIDAISAELVIETAKTVHHDLMMKFGIQKPKIAISGLNPHAGEGGAMGHEEIETIAPAIRHLQEKGIDVVGPLPADTMFHAAARDLYDVAICMYHDQALIPAKTLGFDDAVNVTLGLPIIRTSPDHGTAYDIVGTGKTNPSSFIAALEMAAEMNSHAGTASG